MIGDSREKNLPEASPPCEFGERGELGGDLTGSLVGFGDFIGLLE